MVKKKDILVMVSILLIAAGLFFRDTRPVFAGFSVSLILIGDLFVLNMKAQSIEANFKFHRDSEKKILIRGSGTQVRTRFSIEMPPGIQAVVEDIVPEGSIVDKGDNKSSVIHESGEYTLDYDLFCTAHGTNMFGGVRISLEDSFFSRELVLKGKELSGPAIMIYPRPTFLRSGIASPSGKSKDKISVFRSEDVKGLREYNIFDDIRDVDWKASAKYDKLFVREYASIERDVHTIFIDLPDREDPEANEKAEKIKALAGSILMNEFVTRVDIIMISGPNIIDIIKVQNAHNDAIHIINRLNPQIRDRYLYKYSSETIRSSSVGGNDFTDTLAGISGYYNLIKGPHLFERQVFGILGNISTGDEIFVIALPEIEISHLRIMGELAGIRKLRTSCFIPEDDESSAIQTFRSSCGFDEVNAI